MSSIIALACSGLACGGEGGENRAPVIDGVQLDPAEPTTEDSITAAVQASDPEEDPVTLTYEWYVNDELVGGADGEVLDGSYFVRGDAVHVSVMASDGDKTSPATDSEPVIVVNAAPSAPTVRIEPVTPVAGRAMVCLVETDSEDSDGDDIVYAATWTVDGAPYADAQAGAFDGDTIPAGVTQPDQQWRCTITASDPMGGATGTTSDPVSITCVTGGSATFEVNGAGRNGTIQNWSVPQGVCEIRVEALGARGGEGVNTRGARIRGSFDVSPGDELRILVGQLGAGGNSQLYGGGGSFVVDYLNNPMVVAGGGGVCFSTCPADAETVGRIQTSGGTAGSAPRADNGNGGTTRNTTSGAGGGFYTSGAGASGGRAFMLGGQGGSGDGEGGFGGGGARSGNYGEGGGGGYSGGSCGNLDGVWVGCGGGGSYNSGFDPQNASGYNNGPGRVTITW